LIIPHVDGRRSGVSAAPEFINCFEGAAAAAAHVRRVQHPCRTRKWPTRVSEATATCP